MNKVSTATIGPNLSPSPSTKFLDTVDGVCVFSFQIQAFFQ